MAQQQQQQLAPYEGAIEAARERFQELAKTSGLDVEAEVMFAYQAFSQNGFLAKVANQNPASAQMAVINVAAVGLTLNPAQGLAFLVPRDGQVLLDISYRGLIKLAMDEGAITAAKAELVYEKDHFAYNGPFQVPDHQCNPFSEQRGAMVGAYCSAKLPDGTWLTETMSMADIEAVKATSQSAQKGKGPWVEFFGEMVKKAVTKRASKWWQSASHERLSEAIRLLNEDNGEGFAASAGSATGASSKPDAGSGQTFEHPPEEKADPEQASDFARAKTARVIERAQKTGQWAAAEEYIGERFQGHDLVYAKKQLAQAKPAESATDSE